MISERNPQNFGTSLSDLGETLDPEEKKLQCYLRDIRIAGDISEAMEAMAWQAWLHLKTSLKVARNLHLPVPNATPNSDGELLYTWNKGEHHFELELFTDGVKELFYRNRRTYELWEDTYEIGMDLTEDALDKIVLIV